MAAAREPCKDAIPEHKSPAEPARAHSLRAPAPDHKSPDQTKALGSSSLGTWSRTWLARSTNSMETAAREVESLECRLNAGKRAERQIRHRVVGVLVGASLCTAVISLAFLRRVRLIPHPCWQGGVVWACFVLSLTLMSLAAMPNSVVLARVVIVAQMCMIGTWIALNLAGLWLPSAPADYTAIAAETGRLPEVYGEWSIDRIAFTAAQAIFLCFLLFAVTRRGAGKVQSAMWRSYQTFHGAFLLIEAALTFYCGCACASSFIASSLAGLAVSLSPGFRNRVQSLLVCLFDWRHARAAAASIAGLMGDCEVKDVVAQASARFRCIRRDQLALEHMRSSSPDPALYGLSERARLGSCDAFVSHSWSDDAEGKWEALQQWCDAFVAQRGREPTLWIDKCCIDQSDIDSDLRCLPIFLSGCKEMVVLCGTTYCSRLWCIVELFTHHHMGLSRKRLSVLPVLPAGASGDAGARALRAAVDAFDVEGCQCSRREDRDQITGIIMAAFGTSKAFNETVRAVLHDTGLSQELLRHGGSAFDSDDLSVDSV